jgi:PAS domain S-box-containing protein
MNRYYLDKRILVIDDDEEDFIITCDYLQSIPQNTFTINWCNRFDLGLQALLNHEYDLYLVDYRLGANTGVDFLKAAQEAMCDEPIVLLTGKGNYNIDIQSMQHGAVDYLVKTELTTEKMERCVRYALGRYATLKALKTNERKYRTIFEKSKDVVFVTNGRLDFIEVNPVVEQVLGYPKDEFLKMNLFDLFDGDRHHSGLADGTPGELNDKELTIKTKDGEKKICTLTLSFEDDEAGNLQGIIHDITNIKMMEKVTIQTEKLAATGRLLRTIAHEVRNPLNNISLATEQLQHDVKDEHAQLYLNIVQRNTYRISDLITELLNTSRPSSNVPEKHHLQVVVDAVVAAALDRITLKHIKLSLQMSQEPMMVMADRPNLDLALLNIVTNAVEAIEGDGGLLAIALEREGNKATLTIADNGCGINEENLARLFEPFFTQKRNGVGLGLTFTHNILQTHKAQTDVTSTPGVGTAFKIVFPLVD